MIELTEQQRQAVRNGEAVRVNAPELGEEVVLLSATQYQNIRELLDDEREQEAVLRYSMKQAALVVREPLPTTNPAKSIRPTAAKPHRLDCEPT